MLLSFVYARPTVRSRIADGRSRVSEDHIYCEFVRSEIMDAIILQDTNPGDPPQIDFTPDAFARRFDHLAGKVIGIQLCRPLFADTLVTFLGRQERFVRDYYSWTKWHKFPLLFFEVLESAAFADTVDIVPARLGLGARGLFFEVSEWSMRHCLRSNDFSKTNVVYDLLFMIFIYF